MKRCIALLSILIAAACASTSGGGDTTSSQPGHGAISIHIIPNPIVARHAAGDMYDFPFEVLVRETGGHPVEIDRVSAEVFALGGLSVGEETYDAAEIRRLGYSPSIPANGEIRYRFAPRREVPDERLFSGVHAELRVEGRDEGGAPVRTSTRVTVTR
jgi:hypothetical protein